MSTNNYDRSRLYSDAYVRNKMTLEKAGMKVNTNEAGAIRMADSFLRSEIYLNPGQTEFQMPILTNDPSPGSPVPTPTPTERRLLQQDVFFACELGFFIYAYATGGGNQTWRYEDMTFPNPFLIGGIWTNLDQAVSLWSTPRLNVQVNNVAITPAYQLKKHLYIPEIQTLANGDATATVPPITGNLSVFNPVNYGANGYSQIWPNWILNGGNNNQYTITFPQPINALGLNNAAQCWMVLEWRGFLAQNASSIMKMGK